MKKLHLIILSLFIAGGTFAQTFTLASKDLGGQFSQEFFAGNFGCNGQNKSPELHWINAPAETKSFAVTMHDLDAPTGSGFWHWVIIDIPATATALPRGAGNIAAKLAPAGSLHRINDTGEPGYQGPCPPEGDQAHRYIITVYALKSDKTAAGPSSPAALTAYLLNTAALAKASIIVYGKR